MPKLQLRRSRHRATVPGPASSTFESSPNFVGQRAPLHSLVEEHNDACGAMIGSDGPRKVSFEDGLASPSSSARHLQQQCCDVVDVTSPFLSHVSLSGSCSASSLPGGADDAAAEAGAGPDASPFSVAAWDDVGRMPRRSFSEDSCDASRRNRKRSLHRLPPSKCLSSLGDAEDDGGPNGGGGGDGDAAMGEERALSCRPYKRRSSSEDWGGSSFGGGGGGGGGGRSSPPGFWGQFVDVIPPEEEAAPSPTTPTPTSSSLPPAFASAPLMPATFAPYPKAGAGGTTRRFSLSPRKRNSRLRPLREGRAAAAAPAAAPFPLFAGTENSAPPAAAVPAVVSPPMRPAPAPARSSEPIQPPEQHRGAGGLRTPRPSMDDVSSALSGMSV